MSTNTQTVYDSQKRFLAKLMTNARRCMTVKANGGSVLVEVLHSDTGGSEVWVPAAGTSNITSDGAYIITFTDKDTRITPSGGATFSIQ